MELNVNHFLDLHFLPQPNQPDTEETASLAAVAAAEAAYWAPTDAAAYASLSPIAVTPAAPDW